MSETKMSDIIKSALEGISEFASCNITVGNIISTPSGVTVIPLSKVFVGLATGGVDYAGAKSSQKDNFGGGGGTGVYVTPVALLAVSREGKVSLINVASSQSEADSFTDIISRAPEIISKIKNIMS